mmetsp:Transcript_17294/g.60791  ORF Transcript_17294/g.60791 Transcript_17294/m.60791 type:complete len:282 (+) Transcript_17294:1079-1924(+)
MPIASGLCAYSLVDLSNHRLLQATVARREDAGQRNDVIQGHERHDSTDTLTAAAVAAIRSARCIDHGAHAASRALACGRAGRRRRVRGVRGVALLRVRRCRRLRGDRRANRGYTVRQQTLAHDIHVSVGRAEAERERLRAHDGRQQIDLAVRPAARCRQQQPRLPGLKLLVDVGRLVHEPQVARGVVVHHDGGGAGVGVDVHAHDGGALEVVRVDRQRRQLLVVDERRRRRPARRSGQRHLLRDLLVHVHPSLGDGAQRVRVARRGHGVVDVWRCRMGRGG